MKKAKKAAEPSVFSFKFSADWTEAAKHYVSAGTAYSANKNWAKAREAFEKASYAQEKLGSEWHAAKMMEKAGEAMISAGDFSEARTLIISSSQLMRAAGSNKVQSAADLLTKFAVKFVEAEEADNEDACLELYDLAIEILKDDGRHMFTHDLYRECADILIKSKKYEKAVGRMMDLALVCDTETMRHSQNKAYLGAILVWLYAGDAYNANCVRNDALNVGDFAVSDQHNAADILLRAYESGDESTIKDTCKKEKTLVLTDPCVARLVRRLPGSSVDLKKMAQSLASKSTTSFLKEEHDDSSDSEDLS